MEPGMVPRVERGLSDIFGGRSHLHDAADQRSTHAGQERPLRTLRSPWKLLELNDSVRAIVDRAKAQAANPATSRSNIAAHGHVVPFARRKSKHDRAHSHDPDR